MYGVCRICGCTENIACQHPDHGACWWIDNTHTLCSHCGINDIKNDSTTTHPMKKAFRELPAPFSEVMVKSILQNLKKMTRLIKGLAIVNVDPDNWLLQGIYTDKVFQFEYINQDSINAGKIIIVKPQWNVGDQLWVKETYQHTKILNINPEDENYGFVYKADGQPWSDYEGWRWTTGRFMPKAAARIWLEVTDVKCERLQDISPEDCIAEGVFSKIDQTYNYPVYKIYYKEQNNWFSSNPIESFQSLWEMINGEDSWIYNPWVFAYTFKRITKSG